jgi:hypothetical protein
MDLITSNFDPHPQPSPRAGEGSKNLVPLLPLWEKGLGDEGVQSASLPSNSLGYLTHDPKIILTLQSDFSTIKFKKRR